MSVTVVTENQDYDLQEGKTFVVENGLLWIKDGRHNVIAAFCDWQGAYIN